MVQASELDITINIPEVDDLASLLNFTYYDFCLAMDYNNPGLYVTRAKTEDVYRDLLMKLYNTWSGDKLHEGPFVMNRAIYGMAGGKESDLEKYWLKKAKDCSKPPEQPDHLVR